MSKTTRFALGALLAAACSSPSAPPAGAKQSALTAAQCMYFQAGGKDRICHKTGSAKNPYVMLKISEQACVSAHVAHAGDYIATPTDPDCHGGGCLPEGAPSDPTLPCCNGLTVVGGVCTGVIDLCADVTCAASDQCHVAGACDSATGTCSNPAADDGTPCSDNNGCTATDTCTAGVCSGTGSPCMNGAGCGSDGNDFACFCAPGFTGNYCEINIDECASSPCYAGDCIDGINGYTCNCPPGYSGTNCEIAPPPPPSTYNCADRNPCTPENAANGLFYFPADSPSQFVQCSEWGQCYVMSCPPGLVWDTTALTCNRP